MENELILKENIYFIEDYQYTYKNIDLATDFFNKKYGKNKYMIIGLGENLRERNMNIYKFLSDKLNNLLDKWNHNGSADLLIFNPRMEEDWFFCEMKKGTDNLRDNQIKWIKKLVESETEDRLLILRFLKKSILGESK